MKKILTSLAVLTLGIISANAQNNYDSDDYGLKAGVRVSWDYTPAATNLPGIDSGSGVSAGFMCDVPLYKNLFFEPGVSFFYDTMDIDYFDIYFDGKEVGPSGSVRNMGFRAPLLFGYRFDLVDNIAMSVITGPQVNYGLSAKAHFGNSKVKDIDLYDSNWHRWDAQWTFGIKLHYMDNFFAEITGSVGLTNILDKGAYPDFHLRRNMVNAGIGYTF